MVSLRNLQLSLVELAVLHLQKESLNLPFFHAECRQ